MFYVYAQDPYVSSYIITNPVVTTANAYFPGAASASYTLSGSSLQGGNITSQTPYLDLDVQYK